MTAWDKKYKNKPLLNMDFSLDDGQLDKVEATLGNVTVTKKRQFRVKSSLVSMCNVE